MQICLFLCVNLFFYVLILQKWFDGHTLRTKIHNSLLETGENKTHTSSVTFNILI